MPPNNRIIRGDEFIVLFRMSPRRVAGPKTMSGMAFPDRHSRRMADSIDK